jgi:hypothetical protein
VASFCGLRLALESACVTRMGVKLLPETPLAELRGHRKRNRTSDVPTQSKIGGHSIPIPPGLLQRVAPPAIYDCVRRQDLGRSEEVTTP